MLRNFSIELNRFNSLMWKSGRMFIQQDSTSTEIRKIPYGLFHLIFLLHCRVWINLVYHPNHTLPTTGHNWKVTCIFSLRRTWNMGRYLSTKLHEWGKPGKARTNSWAIPAETELVILSPMGNTNIRHFHIRLEPKDSQLIQFQWVS